MKSCIVVGAGAAGLIAAGFAARGGMAVTVIERNSRPARKVCITGKGRCNCTNNTDVPGLVAHVPRGGKFLYSAFSAFQSDDLRRLLLAQGVPTKTERGNRVFPVSDKAADVANALTRFAEQSGARIVRGRVNRLIIEGGACRGVITDDGRRWPADAVAVCTGGLSYPQTGSTGDGYRLARQAGHTVTELSPSLVPLIIREPDCAQMQGLSLKNIVLTVTDTITQKKLFEEMGEMLFTHFGVSGPLVLSASARMRPMAPDRYRLSIDMKPALTFSQLEQRMLREVHAHINQSVPTVLSTLLPKSMVPVVAQRCGIWRTACHSLTKDQRRRVLSCLKNLSFTVNGFRPIEEAIITAGGVSLKETDARTMRSQLTPGLFFAGEILDADGYTGGFNLQIAFSTGAAAGRAMAAES